MEKDPSAWLLLHIILSFSWQENNDANRWHGLDTLNRSFPALESQQLSWALKIWERIWLSHRAVEATTAHPYRQAGSGPPEGAKLLCDKHNQ